MNKRPRASSNLADFALSGQIIRNRRSLQLRFSLIQTKPKSTKKKKKKKKPHIEKSKTNRF